jgi:pimeloyl-ACP methyl ester carboxylesterase
MDHQSETIFDVIASFRSQKPDLLEVPVFLIGHSLGGILALTMADNPRASILSGLDVSGVPLSYPPEMQKVLDEQAAQVGDMDYLPERSPDEMQAFFYGPEGSYLPEAMAHDKAIHAPVPVAEFFDAAACPVRLPLRMKKLRVPVQLSIPEFEKSSLGGEESLSYARSLLTNSTRVVTWLQRGSGHNISLHKVARAYHLRALAFFDECRFLKDIKIRKENSFLPQYPS